MKGISSLKDTPASRSCRRRWRPPRNSERSGSDLLVAVALGYEVSSRIHRAADAAGRCIRMVPMASLARRSPSGKLGASTRANARADQRVGHDGHDDQPPDLTRWRDRSKHLHGTFGLHGYRSRPGSSSAASRVKSTASATIYGKVLSDTFDPARVVRDLGSEWLIAKGYFKLHPTGRYVHSAIDALEDLLAKVPGGRLDPAEIANRRCALTC